VEPDVENQRPPDERQAVTAYERLTCEEVERLARYNSEVGRGIRHTDEYDAEMARLQRAFDGEREFRQSEAYKRTAAGQMEELQDLCRDLCGQIAAAFGLRRH
jgi:hypothetical protein